MKILNKSEIDSWLYKHTALDGHVCVGIKGTSKVFGKDSNVTSLEKVNIYFLDTTTKEKIDIIYGV